MPDKIDLEAGLKYLKSTKDSMLIDLADLIEKNGKLPNEEELINILAFLLTFSMGCMDLKLPELADKFNDRAERFVVALNKCGMISGKFRDPVRKRWDPVTYNTILNKAFSIAAYKRAGSVHWGN
jgi:hypothetical protein